MYEELRDLIRHGVATAIFRVTVQQQPPPDPGLTRSLAEGVAALSGAATDGNGAAARAARPVVAAAAGSAAAGSAVRNVRETLGDQPVAPGSASGGAADGVRPGYTPTGARIGRNDPCWCGSGAKYKKCHGR
jgi:preprotein translocase subunit SecA